jgi:hypothetical protein
VDPPVLSVVAAARDGVCVSRLVGGLTHTHTGTTAHAHTHASRSHTAALAAYVVHVRAESHLAGGGDRGTCSGCASLKTGTRIMASRINPFQPRPSVLLVSTIVSEGSYRDRREPHCPIRLAERGRGRSRSRSHENERAQPQPRSKGGRRLQIYSQLVGPMWMDSNNGRSAGRPRAPSTSAGPPVGAGGGGARIQRYGEPPGAGTATSLSFALLW